MDVRSKRHDGHVVNSNKPGNNSTSDPGMRGHHPIHVGGLFKPADRPVCAGPRVDCTVSLNPSQARHPLVSCSRVHDLLVISLVFAVLAFHLTLSARSLANIASKVRTHYFDVHCAFVAQSVIKLNSVGLVLSCGCACRNVHVRRHCSVAIITRGRPCAVCHRSSRN
jgi:hypothetical protein